LKTSIRPSAKACGVLESAAYSAISEHYQKPHNAGSRPQARFFNTLCASSRQRCSLLLFGDVPRGISRPLTGGRSRGQNGLVFDRFQRVMT
jgi:hypothetical protein